MTTEKISMDALHNQSTVQFARMLKTAYLNYAVETIKDRALPDIRDGLKPVHRRILYTMHEMRLYSTAQYRKSARVVGDTMGKYHPHGDAAIYDAMVRMAQDFSMRIPLVDGQGNFGSIDGDKAAAMRYTEARMSPLAEELLTDIEADTIEWEDNFDNTLKEPVFLPAKFPNLLVNGSEGIAVGMSCKIPPHNLGEVCTGLIYMAENWAKRDQITVDKLIAFIPGPDFPTGGIIYRNRQEGEKTTDIIRQVYETGQGKIIMQGVISGESYSGHPVSDFSDARRLVITQIPYGLNKSTLLTQIADGVRSEKLKGISDLRDESDYEGMRIVVTVTRGYQPVKVLKQLLHRTYLKATYGVINLALVNNEPQYFSLHRILRVFVEHRLDVIIKRTQYELNRREARLHLVEGLLKALASIDEIIETIRRSRTPETARNNLMKTFGLSEVQATAILDMQLRRLAALERKKLESEQKDLKKRISYLNDLLNSETKRLALVVEETQQVKDQYATPRKTVILELEGKDSPVTKADLLKPTEPQVVMATTRGNLYRISTKSFSLRQSKGTTSRAVDAPLFYIQCGPEDMVLLVTNYGRGWYGAVFRVPEETTNADMGLKKGEVIINGAVVKPDHFLTMAATNGKVKRTMVADLNQREGSWSKIMGGLGEKDEVVVADITDGHCQVMLFTAGAKAIRFSEEDANPQASSTATGVAAMKVAKKDNIVSGAIIQGDETTLSVLLISDKGYAKRMPLTEFSVQGRGGQGVQTLRIQPVTGNVAAATVVLTNKNANIMSGKGRRHHLSVSDFPETSRPAQGEQLVDFGPDDTIDRIIGLD